MRNPKDERLVSQGRLTWCEGARLIGARISALSLSSFLLEFFQGFEERVNGLKLGCKNCPTLGGVEKALF